MPRPNPAQIAYGSATVICSSLAMLLLSQTRSGPGIVVIALAALALGLLVALTAPSARTTHKRRKVVESAEPALTAVHHSTLTAQHPASAPATPAGVGARR
ncbi:MULTISPECIES: hypothetical protein [unclassified Streptomyces]|uniref:hypothetical protein n=1 Tax=unclassified Streptomyces TaxID=2593676 RepID=UPI002DD8FB66|nr:MULTISPECIES: hypothetical protein [unclassified Streptomyces]WSA94482.1 hypothetical protein OIE63_25080 [Streptomyces sp. NBC_01795]WSB78901.1 hypothetical protein OHB04_26200 [Streptomyces sp. NBC_01775]WSS41680.1 hypothetical protein OG220_14560 [Streptomyces sp. NBC_01187]